MRRLIVATTGLLVLLSMTMAAQQSSRKPPPRPPAAAGRPRAERPVPFKVGETLTYDVSWSTYLTAGTAVMTVKEKKPSYNSTAYYVVAEGRPTPLVAKLYTLYYKMDTLIDAHTLLPQRGSSYSEEGSRRRLRTTVFDRAAKKAFFEFRTGTSIKTDFPVSPDVQDALSAIYVLRAIPFRAGDRMTMPVSDNGENYRVQFGVGGPERIRTPLGEMRAWRLTPTISDSKNQRVGKGLSIWLSDDARRLPLKLEAELAVGSFVLTLRQAR